MKHKEKILKAFVDGHQAAQPEASGVDIDRLAQSVPQVLRHQGNKELHGWDIDPTQYTKEQQIRLGYILIRDEVEEKRRAVHEIAADPDATVESAYEWGKETGEADSILRLARNVFPDAFFRQVKREEFPEIFIERYGQ